MPQGDSNLHNSLLHDLLLHDIAMMRYNHSEKKGASRMSPIALDLGLITIRWYGIMAAVSMLSSLYVGRYWARRYGIDEDKFLTLTLMLVPSVIVGGRTAYVLANFRYYREYPEEILRIDHGGFGSHGAVLAVVLVGYCATKAMKMPFWTSADALAPALPLSYLFVRLGNFANGELYGLPTSLPWGVAFPGTTEPRHPSMLYEAFGEVIILLLVLRWCSSRRREGEAFLKAGIAMSVLRVLVDFTRSACGGPVFGLEVTQVLSILMGATCAALLAGQRGNRRQRSQRAASAEPVWRSRHGA